MYDLSNHEKSCISRVNVDPYGGSEVTCRKPDTFLLAATFAAINFAVSLFLLRV